MITEPHRSVSSPDINVAMVTALINCQNKVFGVVSKDSTLANLTTCIENVKVGRSGYMC